MISPFLRTRENETHVYGSICTLCKKVVAHSPDLETLVIAEQAHNCRNWHGRYSDQDVIRPRDLPTTDDPQNPLQYGIDASDAV